MNEESFLIALKERLLANSYETEDGCLYCTLGGVNSRYGTVWFRGRNISNHVASYMVHKGPIPEGKLICHTCDFKRCIDPEHLFIGTEKDNIQDCVRKGRRDKRHGEHNPAAILTEDIVKEIRYFCEHSGLTQQRIADHFGISQVTVSNIKTKRLWPHV